MRLALLRFVLLILVFLSGGSIVFAQEKALQHKLDSLKAKDNLTEWIYERIAYAAIDGQTRLNFLLATQPWRQAKVTEEHHALLNLFNSKGYDQLLAGQILGSINSYETAYAYYLKHKIANYEIVEYTLKPLSNNYTRLGDYERALYLQQLAINFLIKTKDLPENIASAYSNMAISYRAMGKLAAAEASVQQGLKLVKPSAQVYLILHNILADIAIDKGDYFAAAKLASNNIALQKTVNVENAYWMMGSYTTAGVAYLELKNTTKANYYLNEALKIISVHFKGARLREQAHIYMLRGRVKLLQQQALLAIGDFKQSLAILKITGAMGNPIVSKIYGDYRLVEVFQQMANAYVLLQQPDEAFNAIKLALFSADKIRNEFVNDQTKERLQADLKDIAEKGIDLAYQRYLQTKDKHLLNSILELAEQSKARTLVDQIRRNQQSLLLNTKDSLFIKQQALERAIIYNEKEALVTKSNIHTRNTDSLRFYLALVNKQLKQKYQQLNVEREIKVVEMLAALPKGRVIEYFMGKEAVYLIDIKNGQVKQVLKLQQAAALKGNVQAYTRTYFQHGPNAMLNAPKEFYLASYAIYQQLLSPINLVKNEKVTLIPDGVLGYLSFDGLIIDKTYRPNMANWPYLIKNNTLTYAFSLQTLTLQQPIRQSKAFAGLFITHQQNNNVPLKAVQEEADAIGKLLNGRFLFDEEVNAKSFNAVFEESKVLHIGTHAYLSGKNQEPTLDFGPEKLFLFELGAKKNAPALVVLSACRTADGLLANGEGIISLSRGFNAVGTPATIAGLWNVNDVAASVITSSLYQHILNGKSNGEALHQAKLDWLNQTQTSDALYLPYYWDSLIYMGADQHLELNRAYPWWWWMGSGVALILLIVGMAIWLYRRKHKSRLLPNPTKTSIL